MLVFVVINNKIIKEDERKFLMIVIFLYVVNESIFFKKWYIGYNFYFVMNYLYLIFFDFMMFLF